jgi:D-threo-aldose 1-dehydrogenase
MITVPLTSGLTTTPLGFGCADLFRIPSPKARRAMLESAFDAGIRHFDVAPMYGLGVAERELGSFARNRRDQLVIVTKFGILPSPLSRAVAVVQGPIRALLSAAPNARNRARSAAPGPNAGGAGSLLYRAPGYGADAARASLERSLKQLGTDHVDLLLLHDPTPGLVDADDTRAFLDDAQARGLIRSWGVAGEAQPSVQVASRLLGPDQVIQLRDDLVQRHGLVTTAAPPALPRITFGVLGRVLGLVSAHLAEHPVHRGTWNDDLGIDCGNPAQLAELLFQEAFESNPTGVTLFTTTRPDRIRSLVSLRERHNGETSDVVAMLRKRLAPLMAATANGGPR